MPLANFDVSRRKLHPGVRTARSGRIDSTNIRGEGAIDRVALRSVVHKNGHTRDSRCLVQCPTADGRYCGNQLPIRGRLIYEEVCWVCRPAVADLKRGGHSTALAIRCGGGHRNCVFAIRHERAVPRQVPTHVRAASRSEPCTHVRSGGAIRSPSRRQTIDGYRNSFNRASVVC